MVEEFEADGRKKNPYEAEVKGAVSLVTSLQERGLTSNVGLTEAQVRLKLEEQDAKEAAEGRAVLLHEVSPSTFIAMALQLEDEQYVTFSVYCFE